jgi:small-conductance mechanosensitive channel
MPNIKFLEEEVKNYHTNDKRRISVETVVEYGTDISKVKQIL